MRAHCSPLALRQAESALGPDGISQWASMGTFFPWHTAQKPLSKHGSIELDKLPLAPRRCGHRVLGELSDASRAASAAKSASGSSSPLSTPVEYASESALATATGHLLRLLALQEGKGDFQQPWCPGKRGLFLRSKSLEWLPLPPESPRSALCCGRVGRGMGPTSSEDRGCTRWLEPDKKCMGHEWRGGCPDFFFLKPF